MHHCAETVENGNAVNDKYQRGFTLVEVIAISVVAVVLAAFAIPRMMGPGEFAVRTNADRLLAALQYARTLAQTQGVATSVEVNSLTISVKQGAVVKFAMEDGTGDYTFNVHPDVAVSIAGCTSPFTFGWAGERTTDVASPCVFSFIENGATRFTVRLETTGYAYLVN